MGQGTSAPPRHRRGRTFLVGVVFYGDPATQRRLLGLALIVAGVATLRLAH